MKTITLFETRSLGGMELRTVCVRRFETEELARNNALEDDWNDSFNLYKITMTFNGMVTEESEYIERIPCGRE